MSFYLMHRGWRDHHLFKNQPYSDGEAWEYLIANANFVPTKYRQANKVYDVERGNLATSYRSLGEKWKWSTNKVIRFLRLLEKEKMISLKTEHNFLQINVVNYDTYQNPIQEKETLTEHGRNTDGDRKKTKTNTNVNNINNLNNSFVPPTIDSNFEIFWERFPRQRRGDRGKAFSAWRVALTKSTAEEILHGLDAYIGSDEVRDGFAKGAAAWLNDSRWTVDYGFKPIISKQITPADRDREARKGAVTLCNSN